LSELRQYSGGIAFEHDRAHLQIARQAELVTQLAEHVSHTPCANLDPISCVGGRELHLRHDVGERETPAGSEQGKRRARRTQARLPEVSIHEHRTGQSIDVGWHREHWHAGRLRQPERGALYSHSAGRAQPRESHQDVLRCPYPGGVRGDRYRFARFHARSEEGGESHRLVNPALRPCLPCL